MSSLRTLVTFYLIQIIVLSLCWAVTMVTDHVDSTRIPVSSLNKDNHARDVSISIVKYTQTSVTLTWKVTPLFSPRSSASQNIDSRRQSSENPNATILYQLWYWAVDSDSDVLMKSTYRRMIRLGNLTPGELYNIWLIGIQKGVSHDFVTLRHRTSA